MNNTGSKEQVKEGAVPPFGPTNCYVSPYQLTPPELMAQLQLEFEFDFDPCPHPRPEGLDGLTVEWGQSNYVNPPFKGATAWARKCIAEHDKGKRVVFVFPVERWLHRLVAAGATLRPLGDVRWCSTENGASRSAGPIMAFILEIEEET